MKYFNASALHWCAGIVISVLISLIAIALLQSFPYLLKLDGRRYVSLMTGEAPDGRIALILIDDRTIELIPELYKDRRHFARFLSGIEARDSGVLALDVFFEGARPGSQDKLLAAEMLRLRNNIVLARSLRGNGKTAPWFPDIENRLHGGIAGIESDGSDRNEVELLTFPSLHGENLDDIWPSLPVAALCQLNNAGETVDDCWKWYDRFYPMCGHPLDLSYVGCDILIRYVGDHHAFSSVKFEDVYFGHISLDISASVVLVGDISSGSADLFHAPGSLSATRKLFGIEVIANAINTLLRRNWVFPATFLQLLFIASAMAFFAFACGRARNSPALKLFLLVGSGVAAIELSGRILHVFVQVTCVVVAALGAYWAARVLRAQNPNSA